MSGNDHNALVRVRGVVVGIGRNGIVHKDKDGNVTRTDVVVEVLVQDGTGAQKVHLDPAAAIVLEQNGTLVAGRLVEVTGRVDATRNVGIVIKVDVPANFRRG
jgi:DNA/RNA endonuclease YhcR with UshA esterase domain